MKKLLFFYLQKMHIYLSLGLNKGRPCYRRSLQPRKDKIQSRNSKYEISTLFSFLWVRIQIQPTKIKADLCGAGSETLPAPYLPLKITFHTKKLTHRMNKLKILQLKIDINVYQYRIRCRTKEFENAILFSAKISIPTQWNLRGGG